MAAAYQLIYNSTSVLRTADNATIPNDTNNSDWQAYQSWIAAGNTPDPVPLSVLKSVKQSDLDAMLDAQKYKNIVYNNATYFADYNSQILIANSLSSSERGYTNAFPANWGMADGTVVSHTYDDIKNLSFAIADRTKACYTNYQTLAGQIAAAADQASLDAIDITAGWPA